jgi:GWxTD domain-containing protein
MKYKLLGLVLILGLTTNLFGIDASVSHATFKSKTQNYVEVYIHVLGGGLHYKSENNKTVASIETIILLKQGEEIIQFDKFILKSPSLYSPLGDTTIQFNDFSDLKRFALENGEYTLEVTLKDIHAEDKTPRIFKEQVKVNYNDQELLLSDIQPIDNFSKAEDHMSHYAKNGLIFQTHPFGYYSQEYKLLRFYAELYNSQTITDAFYIRYFIKHQNGDKPLQMNAKRLLPQEIHALVLQLDITEIPSGNYDLVVEARDREHKVLSSKTYNFQRSNPYLNNQIGDYLTINYENSFVTVFDEKQLNYALKAILPKMESMDGAIISKVIKDEDLDLKRKYLYNYWVTEDPQTPKDAFKEYMNLVKVIDQKYKSALGLGLETDRGYTYLKYGEPNDIITQMSDPNAPPYEIWEYYELKGQQNVKFVFYNPSLAVNDFELIHSTLRGEVNNPNWMKMIYENAPVQDGNYQDGTRVQDAMGRNAGRIYDQR